MWGHLTRKLDDFLMIGYYTTNTNFVGMVLRWPLLKCVRFCSVTSNMAAMARHRLALDRPIFRVLDIGKV